MVGWGWRVDGPAAGVSSSEDRSMRSVSFCGAGEDAAGGSAIVLEGEGGGGVEDEEAATTGPNIPLFRTRIQGV